jgi:hypothetical protein
MNQLATNRNISSPIPSAIVPSAQLSGTSTSTLSDNNKKLLKEIEKYIKERSFADSHWIEAITSQYFLIELAQLLSLTNLSSYQNLEEEFFNSSCSFRSGKVLPAPSKILVVPDENEELIRRMQQEDENGAVYPERLKAKKIDTKEKKDRIYYNYYYGLMSGTVNRFAQSSQHNINYKTLRSAAVSELFNNDALDEAGGWIHFRLPWITARILISLSTYTTDDLNDVFSDSTYTSPKVNNLTDYTSLIEEANQSIIDRLHGKSFWQSGAGDWVAKWESTGLCLEALLTSGQHSNFVSDIKRVFSYLMIEDNLNEWLIPPSFSTGASSNQSLASVILASVVMRYAKNGIVNVDDDIINRIEEMFQCVLREIKKGNQENVQQYCTVPQILYYIVTSII